MNKFRFFLMKDDILFCRPVFFFFTSYLTPDTSWIRRWAGMLYCMRVDGSVSLAPIDFGLDTQSNMQFIILISFKNVPIKKHSIGTCGLLTLFQKGRPFYIWCSYIYIFILMIEVCMRNADWITILCTCGMKHPGPVLIKIDTSGFH